MATIGPNRQKNIVRIAAELDTKDANSLAPPQTAQKSATSGKKTSAKGGGASSTAPKQKSTPAVKTAGVSDSRGTASVDRQTQATPKITASTQKTKAVSGGLTGGGTAPSLGGGIGTAILRNRLTQLQRIERELENDYHFLHGFEQDWAGEKLYEEENGADLAKKALETMQGWISEWMERVEQPLTPTQAQAREDAARLGMSLNSASLAAAQQAVSSPDYLKRASERQLGYLEQAERDVAEAQRHIYELEQFGNLTRGGEALTSGSFHSAPTQDDLKLVELKKQLKEASGRVARYGQTVTNLSTRYYSAENQGQLDRLAQNQSLSQTYQKAGELQDDLDAIRTLTGELAWMEGRRDSVWDETWAELDSQLAQLYQKYSYTGGKDQRGLAELTLHLRERQQPLVAALEQGGYNFDRLRGYEQTLRDAERYQQEQEKTARFAQEHPVLSSLASIAAVPYQAGEYIDTMTKGVGTNNERDVENYVPLNVYDMKFTNFVFGVREQVAGDIRASVDNETLGNALSFLYQTGMSIGDSAYLITTLGPWASWVMAPNAASQQARDVILRGGSNSQAFWSGLAAGAAEKVFEKFGIDSLLGEKTVTGVKSLLKETAKQAGVEAGEEMLTEISNILSDTVIMGRNSEFERLVDRYMGEELLTEEEARERAFFDQLAQVGLAGLGGWLSGEVMGGVVNTVNYVSQRRNAASGPEAGDGTGAPATPRATEAQKPASTGETDVSLVQRIKQAIPQLQNMEPVATVTGNELPNEGNMIDRLVSFVRSIGNKATRPGLGDVLFSKGRIKNSMLGHGVGRAKVETMAAVPAVIEKGQQIDFRQNWKGRGYATYTFAGPVEYRGKPTYLGVIVTKDAQDGRYYLHEVVDENGDIIFFNEMNAETASDGRASLSGAVDTVATSASDPTITKSVSEVNTLQKK